ncbi:MAG TPA: hypothetical protein VGH32_05695, partial [Pirellulales bacterium]
MRKSVLISLSLCIAAGAAIVAVGQEFAPQPYGMYADTTYSAKVAGPQLQAHLNGKIGECVQ